MSIFDEMFDDENLDEHEFEIWLDSINESGDPERDEECYYKEMDRINKETFSQEIGENMESEEELMELVQFPEFRVKGTDYICTYSVN